MERVEFRLTPYTEIAPIDSVGLYGWNEICAWRARNQGNVVVKLGAEAGFFANEVFSLLETIVRAPVYFAVCNKLSRNIATIVSTNNEESAQRYEELSEKCEASFDKCLQSVAQNFISMGTNLVSHEQNMATAQAIKDRIEDISPEVVEKIRNYSPLEQGDGISVSTNSIANIRCPLLGLLDIFIDLAARRPLIPKQGERD